MGTLLGEFRPLEESLERSEGPRSTLEDGGGLRIIRSEGPATGESTIFIPLKIECHRRTLYFQVSSCVYKKIE